MQRADETGGRIMAAIPMIGMVVCALVVYACVMASGGDDDV